MIGKRERWRRISKGRLRKSDEKGKERYGHKRGKQRENGKKKAF